MVLPTPLFSQAQTTQQIRFPERTPAYWRSADPPKESAKPRSSLDLEDPSDERLPAEDIRKRPIGKVLILPSPSAGKPAKNPILAVQQVYP
ncbi:hypothetical protein Emag_000913 [Eimeria magna]